MKLTDLFSLQGTLFAMMLIGAGAFLALALGFCLFTADAPVVERAFLIWYR